MINGNANYLLGVATKLWVSHFPDVAVSLKKSQIPGLFNCLYKRCPPVFMTNASCSHLTFKKSWARKEKCKSRILAKSHIYITSLQVQTFFQYVQSGF